MKIDDRVALKDYLELKTSSLSAITDLQFKLNQVAIDKAELRADLTVKGVQHQVEQLQRFMYIGIGITMAFSFLIRLLIK